jgi:PAS domain S-box-containing protein
MVRDIEDYASLYLDEHGYIKNWNKGAEKIKGYAAAEIIGKNFSVFYTTEDQERAMPSKILEEAHRKGFSVYAGWRVRKDTTQFWGEIVITALYDQKDIFMGFSEITRDLTNRNNKDELERRNLDALINNTTDLMFSIDLSYNLISFNNAFADVIYQMSGCIVQHGLNVAQLGMGDDRNTKYKKLYDRAFAGANFKEIEYNDTPFESWTEISFYPIRKEDNVVGTACYTHDITTRIKANEKIIRSEHRFRSLIEHSTDAVMILSEQLKSVYISPSVPKVTGCAEESARLTDFFSLIHAENLPQIKEIFNQALAAPFVPLIYLCRLKMDDNSRKWIEGTFTNRLGDPAICGIVNNFRDVTSAKIYEEQLVHAKMLYAFISQINQTIVYVRDEQQLFREVCRIAVEIGKFKIAWIGLANTENKTITLVESRGMAEEDLHLFNPVRYCTDDPQDRATQGQYFICNNFMTDPETITWRPYMLRNDVNSCMVLPIWRSGKVIGTASLYATETNYFKEKEVALLKEVAGDISFAQNVFEIEKSRQLAERMLKHKEFRLNQAQSIANIGSYELDLFTGNGVWSAEACRIYGLTKSTYEHSFKLWLSFVHPDDLELVKKITKNAELMKCSTSFYHRIIKTDGSIRHIHSQAEFEFDNEGNATGLNGIVHDITDFKENVMQLKEQNRQLKEIAWIQSHRVRGPLATILGLAELLKEDLVSAEVPLVIQGILDSSKKLDTVIREIVGKTEM